MINNFYTLEALVRAWRPDLVGCTVGDAFSQVAGELTLAFAHPAREWMLRCSVQAPFLFIFRSEGYSKARRNVATLFEQAFDRAVEDVRIAERDRMLYLDLEGGFRFQLMLFGSRANAFLVNGEGVVVEAFRGSDAWAGKAAPDPRPAPRPDAWAAFEERWRPNRNTTGQALASAFPLFDRTLAAEVVHRAGVTTGDPAACTEAERRTLFEAARALQDELEDPSPRIYWKGHFADTFSLVELRHRAGQQEEPFGTVDEAARVFVRRRLAEEHFRRLYEPLEEALEERAAHYRRSAARMREELSGESRAEQHERFGHLLMAAQQDVPAGADEAALPDLFGDGGAVTIPLDPALSAVENAQRYYEKARRTRASRASARRRLAGTEARAEEAARLLDALRAVETLSDLKRFRKDRAEQLAPFMKGEDEALEQLPFRRFPLGQGYEVWVGKNARQNDALTFQHAQKYDLWMHARGLPGAHAVLRLPGRDAEPPKRIVQQAASVAAYYSKGRGSKLVPVMVTKRKYVRSPSGAPPGAVHVEREEVLLVAPRLPGSLPSP